MTKARGLGRGLGALIPELEEAESEGRLELVISDIKANPFQPRREFDQEKLDELAASIREHGVLQPILVRRGGGGYELVAGERRLRAAEMAGLQKIPAVIGEFPDIAMMQIALVENLQRADLNPMEEALAYRRLLDEFGMTQEEIAQKVGKSRPAIANTLRLLNLPPSVQKDLSDGRTTVGHARALLGLKGEDAQLDAWKQIKGEDLSVRETEELVRTKAEKFVSRETGKKKQPVAEVLDPDTKAVEDRMRQALGTKVRIHTAGSGGKIEIEYYSQEELGRIMDVIVARST